MIEDFEEELLKVDIGYAETVSQRYQKQQGTLWSFLDAEPPEKDYLEARGTDLVASDSQDEIISKAERVFADTFEEFSSIKVIKQKFETWKFR